MDKQDINFLILNGSLLILCPMAITFVCKIEISKNGILKNEKRLADISIKTQFRLPSSIHLKSKIKKKPTAVF